MLQGSTPLLFHPSDYASLTRRLIACILDLVILLGALSMATTAVGMLVVPRELYKITNRAERQKQIDPYLKPYRAPVTAMWFVGIPAYHIFLRRLRGGTPGYRIAGIRIVDAYALPPVTPVLIKRFLIAFPFVLFFGLSYFPVPKHPRRQAGHDQWSGTWLVRKHAHPTGPAQIAYQTKLLGTWLIKYPDLEPAPIVLPDSEPPP